METYNVITTNDKGITHLVGTNLTYEQAVIVCDTKNEVDKPFTHWLETRKCTDGFSRIRPLYSAVEFDGSLTPVNKLVADCWIIVLSCERDLNTTLAVNTIANVEVFNAVTMLHMAKIVLENAKA